MHSNDDFSVVSLDDPGKVAISYKGREWVAEYDMVDDKIHWTKFDGMMQVFLNIRVLSDRPFDRARILQYVFDQIKLREIK